MLTIGCEIHCVGQCKGKIAALVCCYFYSFLENDLFVEQMSILPSLMEGGQERKNLEIQLHHQKKSLINEENLYHHFKV